jgi:large subunit ribosomal protein L4
MPIVKVYDKLGKKSGELKLSDDLFAAKETRTRMLGGEEVALQRNLLANLHQTVLAEQANKRQGTHSTKGRAEVRGGGRKPWRQKKVGRARHGSTRSPLWSGGGVTFGPKPRSHSQKLNRGARRLAIQSALGAKIAEGALIVVDGIAFERPKTKDALEFLKTHGVDEPRTLVILAKHDPDAIRSFRNLSYVELRTSPDFSARDVLLARKIIADKAALQSLEEMWSK